MKEVQQLLEKQIKKTNIKIKEIQSYLENSSSGILVVSHSKEYTRLYNYYNGTRKYLNKNDKEIISSLANTKYLSALQGALLKQKEYLKKALAQIKRADGQPTEENIYNKLQPEIKEFVVKDILDTNFAKRWQSIKYRRVQISQEIPYYTDKKEHVRSKSELIIANTLNKRNIPYHYECELTLNDKTLLPDFTILNKRTREIYIWEHFGMMDDAEYRNRAHNKLEIYAVNNYFLGKNLIATYEDSEAPLNTEIIENLITKFLL